MQLSNRGSGLVMVMMKATEPEQTGAEEILAMGRMVSFVCQRARDMNLEMSAYFLEMALTSLVEDMGAGDGGTGLPDDHAQLATVNDLH